MRSLAVSLLALASFLPAPLTRAGEGSVVLDMQGDFYNPDRSEARGEAAQQGWWTFASRFSTSASHRVIFSVRAILEEDTHGSISHTHLYDEEDRDLVRSPLRFEELSLKFDLGALDLEVGRQRLVWGRTDVVRPTDNLTPRDWTDPLDEQRLSPWALRGNYEKGRWMAELAGVARYAPSRLPLLGDRWFETTRQSIVNPRYNPRDPNNSLGPPRLQLRFSWDEAKFPFTRLTNVQRAVRGGYRGQRVEWTLSYYRGFDDAPHVSARPGTPQFVAGFQPILLTRRFPRLDVAGGDFQAIAGRWAFRGEAGYFHFPQRLDNGYLLYDLEMEWTRKDWSVILGGADVLGAELKANLFSDVQKEVDEFRRTGRTAPGTSSAIDQVFLPAGFFRAGRNAPTEWQASVEAMVGLDRGDRLVRLSGSWPLKDWLRAGGELDLMSGPPQTLYGTWGANDRLRVFLSITL